MGVPVICSNAGGLPENIKHDETGYIVPRRDVESIFKSIIKYKRETQTNVAFINNIHEKFLAIKFPSY